MQSAKTHLKPRPFCNKLKDLVYAFSDIPLNLIALDLSNKTPNLEQHSPIPIKFQYKSNHHRNFPNQKQKQNKFQPRNQNPYLVAAISKQIMALQTSPQKTRKQQQGLKLHAKLTRTNHLLIEICVKESLQRR